jgi:hypothetical protein
VGPDLGGLTGEAAWRPEVDFTAEKQKSTTKQGQQKRGGAPRPWRGRDQRPARTRGRYPMEGRQKRCISRGRQKRCISGGRQKRRISEGGEETGSPPKAGEPSGGRCVTLGHERRGPKETREGCDLPALGGEVRTSSATGSAGRQRLTGPR